MGAPRHLLILRFALVNVVCFGLAGGAWLEGWLDRAFAGASLWPCLLIAAVFAYGLGLCGLRLWQVGCELDDAREASPAPRSQAAWYLAQLAGAPAEQRVTLASLLRMRLAQSPATVRHVAGMLVLLGLVGTVIGFIVALSGVDPRAVPSVENVAPMVARLINGMSIALYTTLVGSVLHLWLMVTQRILAGGSLALYQAIVELGGAGAGAR